MAATWRLKASADCPRLVSSSSRREAQILAVPGPQPIASQESVCEGGLGNKRSGMTASHYGVGAYTIPEASRLLRMTPTRLRRWLYGYDYEGGECTQPALWNPQYDSDVDGQLIGFRDLIEARIVEGLRRAGFGLPTIRSCITAAREILGDEHPFSTTAFKTDGRKLFLDITGAVEDAIMYDLKSRQRVFREVVLPSLSGLDFGSDVAARWWLVPGRRTIVADPERSFGQPIVAASGLLTARVVQEVKAEGTPERVAKLYQLPIRSIRDALRFEHDHQLRKAA